MRSDPQTTPDDLLHDLGGASVDRLNPGVQEGTGDAVFAHVSVSTVKLEAAVDEANLDLGGPPLGHRCLLGGELLIQM